MNLRFMERSLSEKHREAGLYVEQTGDDTIALMRTGKMLPIASFDSRCPCQSVVDAADQYLGELVTGISFERRKKMIWIRRDRETGELSPISVDKVKKKIESAYIDVDLAIKGASINHPLTTGFADYYPLQEVTK